VCVCVLVRQNASDGLHPPKPRPGEWEHKNKINAGYTYCTKITRQATIMIFIVVEWHRGVISDSILALKDLRTEDVPEHSLHERDAFKILGWRGENVHSLHAEF